MVYQCGIDFRFIAAEHNKKLRFRIGHNRHFLSHSKRTWKKRRKGSHKAHLAGFLSGYSYRQDIYKALELEWEDFEDSVQYIVGEELSADYIVTRNTKDFSLSSIEAVTPEQFIQVIADIEE